PAQPRRSGAPVDVVQALDVVLAEVAARLDLDQFHRSGAPVAQAAHAAARNVRALVLLQVEHLAVAGDLGHAGDDHPVLGAVAVPLQAQPRAGLDHDALDLDPFARVDRVVAAPRAIDLAVEGVLLAPGFPDAVHDALDVLHPVLARDQGGVLGVDDHQVLDADRGDHAPVRGPHQVVAAVQRQHVAFEAV